MMKLIKSNLQFNVSKLQKLIPNKVLLVILHHRAGNGDVESIHAQHLKNGWAGIGYHFYIRKDGTVYEGRPIAYVGSHCKGNNSCSLGVCLEGDFRKEVPTLEQLIAVRDVYKMVRKTYRNIYKMVNHRDLYKTACPCTDLAKLVEGIMNGNNKK